MARQIDFYLDKEKRKELIDHIYDRDLIMIEDEPRNVMRKFDKNNRQYEFIGKFFLYKEEWGELKYIKFSRKEYYIDEYTSPVIEFFSPYNEKNILGGNIYLEYSYFFHGEIEYKNPDILKEYNHLIRWIKKEIAPMRELDRDVYIRKEYMSDVAYDLVVNKGYKLI